MARRPDKTTRRWIQSEADERAAAAGYWFDERAADHVVAFFRDFLVHTKGKWQGQPIELLDWQRDQFVMPLFGWMEPGRKNPLRRYRVAYIEIPKKNGKSTICAGLGLYLLAGDGEPGAEVYCAAADRDQAGIVYREASSMVSLSEPLAEELQPIDSRSRIVYPGTLSFLRVLSRESRSGEGINIHGLIFDELHAQPDRALWDTLRYGGAAREQPLIVSITTAGHDRHSICWEQHEYARKIHDGTLQDHQFFGLVYAADENDDWTDEATWFKANPSLGHTIRVEDMRSACEEAKNSPAKETSFKRYRLNVWGQRETRWLSMPAWDACGEPFDHEILDGRECWQGLDLASTTDVASLATVFPPTEDDPIWRLIARHWIPEDTSEQRSKRDGVPYAEWADAGLVTLTPGNVVDYDWIKREVCEQYEAFDVRELAIDRYNATQITIDLGREGLEVVPFGQGMVSMSAPSKRFETLILSGRLGHGGDPVLRWMAGNAAAEIDAAGNVKPTKKLSADKIDGIVAAIMAIGRAMVAEEPERSVYQDRGFRVI